MRVAVKCCHDGQVELRLGKIVRVDGRQWFVQWENGQTTAIFADEKYLERAKCQS